MNKRLPTALIASILTIAALAGCSTDSDTPQAPPSAAQTTAPIDPFEGNSPAVVDMKRAGIDRIIEIGHARGEKENAIIAALTASRAEAGWWIALDGTSYDLFGWNPRFGNKSRNLPATVEAITNRFYDRGRASGLDPETSGPVDYAVIIQTTDTRVVDKSGDQRDYYQDRTSVETRNDRSRLLGTEEKVRAEYTKVLPLAQAAYSQLGQ